MGYTTINFWTCFACAPQAKRNILLALGTVHYQLLPITGPLLRYGCRYMEGISTWVAARSALLFGYGGFWQIPKLFADIVYGESLNWSFAFTTALC